MNEDREKEGKNATYSIFFSTCHAVPSPPPHAGLSPAPNPPPLLYLVKAYWFWEGQPHPASSEKPPSVLQSTLLSPSSQLHMHVLGGTY